MHAVDPQVGEQAVEGEAQAARFVDRVDPTPLLEAPEESAGPGRIVRVGPGRFRLRGPLGKDGYGEGVLVGVDSDE